MVRNPQPLAARAAPTTDEMARTRWSRLNSGTRFCPAVCREQEVSSHTTPGSDSSRRLNELSQTAEWTLLL